MEGGTPPASAPPPDAAPADDDVSGGRAGVTAVLDAMRALPTGSVVLALRYYLDLSEAEIADALGIARGSVKRARLARRRDPALPPRRTALRR